MRTLSFALLLVLACPPLPAAPLPLQDALVPRQVAAPASDLLAGVVRLGDPAASATRSGIAILRVELRAGSDGVHRARVELPLAGQRTRIATVSSGSLDLTVVDGRGRRHDPSDGARVERSEWLEAPFEGRLGRYLELQDLAPGQAALELRADADPGPVWVLVDDGGPARALAWPAGWERRGDRPVPILARLESADQQVERGELVLEDGRRLPLVDDGSAGDGEAGDGLFGGGLPPGTVGPVRITVELRGRGPAGPFLRSVPLAFTLHEPPAVLLERATTRVAGRDVLQVELAALPLAAPRRLHVSAEVWGRDALGRAVPVCWLSRLVDPEPRGERIALGLALDGRWLDHAGARPPLELREVRLQDPDTHGVLESRERVELVVDALPPLVGRGPVELGTSMLTGSAVGAGPQSPAPPVGLSPALMLVHGYCSSGTPWPAAAFSTPRRVFLDPGQNRSHDEFAQLLVQQAAGLTSFGVVGHSQGGCAALHLRTYYHSPLDQASGGRRMQSLATPYQGTPLASLGFFACGVNDDLTPSGAAAWLAGIPTWARSEVWYWTVSDGGSACNFLASLVLSSPEDGTVEVARGQLPGGNSMGNTTGWCHTSGMSYPACTTDAARNAELDAEAAR